MIRVRRTYDRPTRGEGARMLVERLWPRGMKKADLQMDAWPKEVAPSTELRKWFGHRVERWEEFQRRYRAELDANPAAWKPILAESHRGNVTLLYSAHDPLHNGALVLRDYLQEHDAGSAEGFGQGARSKGTAAAKRASPTRSRRSRTQRT